MRCRITKEHEDIFNKVFNNMPGEAVLLDFPRRIEHFEQNVVVLLNGDSTLNAGIGARNGLSVA